MTHCQGKERRCDKEKNVDSLRSSRISASWAPTRELRMPKDFGALMECSKQRQPHPGGRVPSLGWIIATRTNVAFCLRNEMRPSGPPRSVLKRYYGGTPYACPGSTTTLPLSPRAPGTKLAFARNRGTMIAHDPPIYCTQIRVIGRGRLPFRNPDESSGFCYIAVSYMYLHAWNNFLHLTDSSTIYPKQQSYPKILIWLKFLNIREPLSCLNFETGLHTPLQ